MIAEETDESLSQDPRVARSKALIVGAATAEFLEKGFAATSLDDVALRAGVSKRTIYNNYEGKEQLFQEVLAMALNRAETFAVEVASALGHSEEIGSELRAAASSLARAVLDDRIVLLRRLLIGEANRFPDMATEYYRRAPGRVLDALAGALRRYTQKGLLAVDDPALAAEHLAYLVLGASLDQALFGVESPSPAEMERLAEAGVVVFLRAYAP